MIIVTGISGGIGSKVFEYYKDQDIIGLYNNTVPQVYHKGIYQLDLSNYNEVKEFFSPNIHSQTNIILINLASITYNSFAHNANNELWKKVIEINLIGTFNIIHCVLEKMRTNNYGRIINFSSILAQKGTLGTSAYAASKSALWGLTKAISKENGRYNITINNINLGYTEVGMIEQVPDNIRSEILKEIPNNKLCPVEDIIRTINYIIDTPYLNGTSIDLNGGLL